MTIIVSAYQRRIIRELIAGENTITLTPLPGEDFACKGEFEPLPPGEYQVSADTTQGLWAEEHSIAIRPRSCSEASFALEPDGIISGQVTTADGQLAKNARVAIVPVPKGNLGFTSNITNELGRFEVKALHPGRYLVGVGIQALPGSPEWRSRVYYPGVRDQNLAAIIELGRAEKRTNVDFQLPDSTKR